MVGITTLKNVRNIKAQVGSEKPFKTQDPMAPDQLGARAGLGKILQDKFMSSMLTLAAAIASGTNSFGRKGLIFASLALSACIAFSACGDEKQLDWEGGDTDSDIDSDSDTDTDSDSDGDGNGSLVWAKNAGGSASEYGNSISVFGNNSSVIGGEINSTSVFGEGEENETTLEFEGEFRQGFVAKYTDEGELAWAHLVKGESYVTVDEVSVGDEDISVVGTFGSTLTLQGSAGQLDLGMLGSGSRPFVAKYDLEGNPIWVKCADSEEFTMASAEGVGVLPDGGVVVTGNFVNNLTFGEGESTEVTLVSEGDEDVFLAKYNSDGTFAWVKQIGGEDVDLAAGLAMNSSGSWVITGTSSSYEVVFGEGESNEAVLTPYIWGKQLFVASYNPDGTLTWLNNGEGDNYSVKGVDLNDAGAVGVSGSFLSDMRFGENIWEELENNDGEDGFVAIYHPDGSLNWVTDTDALSNERINGVGIFEDGSVVVTGMFQKHIVFDGEDSITIGGTTGSDTKQIFIAKYTLEGDVVWAQAEGKTNDASASAITISASERVLITGGAHTCKFGEGANEIEVDGFGGSDAFIAMYY